MSKKILILALVAVFLMLTVSAFSAHVKQAVEANSVKAPMKYAPFIGGDKTFGTVPYFPGMPNLIAASPGDIVGYTQYDYQSNGSSGTRIVNDGVGGIQVAWMNAPDYNGNLREIDYNYFDRVADEWNWPGIGFSISYRNRDGYCQLATMSDGRAVVAYHNGANDSDFVAINTFPGASGFDYFHPVARFDVRPCIWPYVTVDHSGRIHLVVTDTTTSNGIVAYTRSVNGGTTWSPAVPVDTITTLSAITVSSPVSGKVAIVYTHPVSDLQTLNDIFYIQSPTGLSWDWANGKINVTDYENDTDSLYAYTDIDAVYDYNDSLHIVWSAWLVGADSGLYYNQRLFHCNVNSGLTNIINIFDSTWYDTQVWCDFGGWNFGICKMSIGVDPTNNALFTTYTSWNIADCAMSGYANGDIFMSYSIDGGIHWTMKGNLTDSHTDSCLAGECDSDHWSSLAEKVDDDLHVFYVNDKDAGAVVQSEGSVTDNPMMYLAYANPVRTLAVPLAPVLTYPVDSVAYYFTGGGGGYFQFDWRDPVGVVHYQIQLDTLNDFNAPLFDDSVYTYSDFINPDSLGYGTYFWKVRGIGIYGIGPWSRVNIFHIVPPPGTVAGTVYGPDGITPLAGVTINTYDVDDNLIAINTSDPLGVWTLDLIPATYHEVLSKIGYFDFITPDFTIVTVETTHVSVTMQVSGPQCHYVIGDANGNGAFNGLDVTYSVGYFKGGPPPPYPCACGTHGTFFVAGDVNNSCSFNGLDVTYMVAYFKGGPGARPCEDCPPVP